MYTYKEFDHQQLKQRAAQFLDQVSRFQAGKLDDEKFTQLRLRNGLYNQRHAHMLRVAIPYGTLNSAQLIKLSEIANTYDKGYGHFTTRQNIQFNWPELVDAPKILDELADVGMHAIQTSGSCIRNITSDHLAGVAVDEIEDPRPWCEILRQWSTFHPEFNWLPRKFKFAVTGAKEDRAAIQLHDIGIRIVKNDVGELRFQIFVGGGMGRTPVIGKLIHDSLKEQDLLSYLEAILRVYNQFGRRDHKYRSRIKILVNDLGLEEFEKRVLQEWKFTKDNTFRLSEEQISRIKTSFQRRPNKTGPINSSVIPVHNNRYQQWFDHNTETHRETGYRIVHISLKEPGVAPGDMTAEQMFALAELAKVFSEDEIRVNHEQNLILPYVKTENLYTLWNSLELLKLATPNIGTLNDMICCPGLDFCSLANAGTIDVAADINKAIAEFDRLYDAGNIKLKMSGCMNACGHHHAGHIGILGVDKKGEEWYQITLGGSAANDTRLGKRLGPAIARDKIASAIEIILETYLSLRKQDETFLNTVIRVGTDPFKEKVYADNSKQAA